MKSEFPLSSNRIRAIKTELSKLTDVDYLKKELHRIAEEIKNFDVSVKLSPQARKRLKSLESRFHKLKVKLVALQRQVDKEVNRFAAVLKRSALEAEQALRAVTNRGPKRSSKKTSGKKSTSAKPRASKKATRKKSI